MTLQERLALAHATLKAAALKPWRDVTVFDIAAAGEIDLGDLASLTPADALDSVEWSFDRAVAQNLTVSDGSIRDLLFDLIMRRFEAMESYRAGVLSIDGHAQWDPAARTAQHARLTRAARWILALARLEPDGVAGAARAQGLALILAQTRAAWRHDQSGDFVRTMATLDKALRQAEQTFGRFAGFGARAGEDAAAKKGAEQEGGLGAGKPGAAE